MNHEEHQRRLAEVIRKGETITRDTAALAERIQIVALHKTGSQPIAISQRLNIPINGVLKVLGHPLK